MDEPVYTCKLCGRRQVVSPYVRGHPPDVARRRLVNRCKANGCESEPEYLAGMMIGMRVRSGELPGGEGGDGQPA